MPGSAGAAYTVTDRRAQVSTTPCVAIGLGASARGWLTLGTALRYRRGEQLTSRLEAATSDVCVAAFAAEGPIGANHRSAHDRWGVASARWSTHRSRRLTSSSPRARPHRGGEARPGEGRGDPAPDQLRHRRAGRAGRQGRADRDGGEVPAAMRPSAAPPRRPAARAPRTPKLGVRDLTWSRAGTAAGEITAATTCRSRCGAGRVRLPARARAGAARPRS